MESGMDPSSPQYDDPVSDGGISVDEDEDVKQELHTSPHSPLGGTVGATGQNGIKIKGHQQKRRRVTRACDECRRKKIKCDGTQPCTHCTVYSYDCTYDQPSNRRRNPAPQYVENLEHRVHRAETLLHILIPNLDLNDPGIDAAVQQGWIPGAPGRGNPTAAAKPEPAARAQRPDILEKTQNKSDTNLESMVRAVAQLDMDERGHWDYHGHSSGLSFVRRMREQLGDLMGPDTKATPFVMTRPMSQVLESPKSTGASPSGDVSPAGATDLPPQEYAREVCRAAVDDASVLLRVVHQPTFWKSFDDLYSKGPEHYTNEDNKFLPLFHTVMALGHLFCKDEKTNQDQHYENGIQQGFAHFKCARQMMDIADCRDLTSIQAVMFMILFLQSSAKLSQCYAYVGVALRSALRMGLHRTYAGNWNPVEAETRKRVFWIVRKMDIYVGAMLGLPQTLSDEDIDQDFPLEVDDEYITEEGIMPMPEGTVSLMTAFNAHTRLVQLISKIVRKVYPIKTSQSLPDKSYSVPFSVIREIEGELEQWKTALPAILSPCPAPPRYTRIQQLLRLSYAHAQVMLYKPFLHYVAMHKRASPVDQRAYACAASYVNVSRNIIHIVTQMKQKGLLNGAFWFIMYTSFFAILSLVYFAAENPDNATTQAVMKDALEGRRVLASLARRSMAADRCTATLNGVFQRLPDWMQEGQQNPNLSKKRHLEQSPAPMKQRAEPRASHSHPDVSVVGSSGGPPVGHSQAKRASTFPKHSGSKVHAISKSTSSANLEAPWPQGSGAPSLGPKTSAANGGGFDANAFGQWDDSPGMSASSGSSMSNSMQQYTMPQTFANPALPDLSAMMFPTADEPLGYPNQPLTTFENNQLFAAKSNNNNVFAFGNGNGIGMDMDTSGATTNPMIPRPVSGGREDNIEAQYFALPPYIEQRQQQQQQQQRAHAMAGGGFAGLPFTNGGQVMGNARMAAHQQQQQMASQLNGGVDGQEGNGNEWMQDGMLGGYGGNININIQDLFGGAEWNPMVMGHGFGN
ncbi:Gypsy retrotransposon integrase-like protein 1 [Friedmanniomyces endolithicus]|uniref:Gypsy retrotransposon integrase-like protein 1 n=1 Tax=Friedmanniomyces endolithicus TaxID=329885 RepID=A0AAN6H7N4_9PEZI|nr:Gypsy retrotransposon integrase-like protein 1 [Friedmanniomyces endolithicus]KAK0789703.1 Gypsy retrotransposon integrase-like protein 1 [Friedmanniomyces endolithicus]KAK0832680.1 Gypsy retrotransposon integrase-like protein 1 [Friedmanniomyces endolithicus]KAK0923280.1 Gypsy retrotransposon integrase-like protein 1 [Friedmanniomyces endolithicus]KAK0959230.1 Gypsy retrotransposon integrase-like protein 1 [Friedmanniomyces endolithicus]